MLFFFSSIITIYIDADATVYIALIQCTTFTMQWWGIVWFSRFLVILRAAPLQSWWKPGDTYIRASQLNRKNAMQLSVCNKLMNFLLCYCSTQLYSEGRGSMTDKILIHTSILCIPMVIKYMYSQIPAWCMQMHRNTVLSKFWCLQILMSLCIKLFNNA